MYTSIEGSPLLKFSQPHAISPTLIPSPIMPLAITKPHISSRHPSLSMSVAATHTLGEIRGRNFNTVLDDIVQNFVSIPL